MLTGSRRAAAARPWSCEPVRSSAAQHYFAVLDGVRVYIIGFAVSANSQIPAEAEQILQSFRILN
jgi:hypothetical protein